MCGGLFKHSLSRSETTYCVGHANVHVSFNMLVVLIRSIVHLHTLHVNIRPDGLQTRRGHISSLPGKQTLVSFLPGMAGVIVLKFPEWREGRASILAHCVYICRA